MYVFNPWNIVRKLPSADERSRPRKSNFQRNGERGHYREEPAARQSTRHMGHRGVVTAPCSRNFTAFTLLLDTGVYQATVNAFTGVYRVMAAVQRRGGVVRYGEVVGPPPRDIPFTPPAQHKKPRSVFYVVAPADQGAVFLSG